MLRDGVDAKTASTLGGWADIGLFMKTYAHAMRDHTITEGLFGTPATRADSAAQSKQGLNGK